MAQNLKKKHKTQASRFKPFWEATMDVLFPPLPQSNACIFLPFQDICTPLGLHSPSAPPPPKLASQITEDAAE